MLALRQAFRGGLRSPMMGSTPMVTLRSKEVERRVAECSAKGFATGRESKLRNLLDRTGGRSSEQAGYLVALAIALVGATYGAVPLYRMFCATTGYGGTVQEGETVEAKLRKREENPDPEVEAAAAKRLITVSFNADVSDGMPWKFVPTQRNIKVHPGQSALAFYTATNLSDHAITGVSTYNVAPMQAGIYFNKIQCFCFEEQKLRPGESIDMPIFFYIDPEYATDPRLRHINALTLSYTFFKVSEDEEYQPMPVPVPSTAHA